MATALSLDLPLRVLAAGQSRRGVAKLHHLCPLVGCGEGRGRCGVELYAVVRLVVTGEGLSHREGGKSDRKEDPAKVWSGLTAYGASACALARGWQ